METKERTDIDARIDDLDRRLTALENRDHWQPTAADAPALGAGPEFWALAGLRERAPAPGAVLFTGTVTLPTGERYEWQHSVATADVLATEWALSAPTLAALGHSVRLLLLREVVHGTRTAAELGALDSLGTTGQLYHHLRQLVAAGWLRTTGRGLYSVPPERVVPLLIVLAAAAR